MTYLDDLLNDAAGRIGSTPYEVRASLRSAVLTLDEAEQCGFESIDEYADAIREYAANC